MSTTPLIYADAGAKADLVRRMRCSSSWQQAMLDIRQQKDSREAFELLAGMVLAEIGQIAKENMACKTQN